jgi:hypothetical protein
MLTAQSADLRKPLFEQWSFIFPAIILTALLAVFALELLCLFLAGVLFVYFWNHKDKFVLFLIIYTPFEEVVLKILPDSLYAPARYMWEGMLFAMLGLMLFERFLLTRQWKKSIIDTSILAFILVWLLSGLVNDIPVFSSLASIKNLVRYVAIFYIIYNLKPDKKFLSKVIFSVIIIAVIQSVICIGQAIEGDVLVDIFRPKDVTIGDKLIRVEDVQLGSYYTRFTGSFTRSNDLGNYLTFALCFLTTAYLSFSKRAKYFIPLLLILTALILSSSRISWISAFLAVGVILIKIRHKFRFVYFAVPFFLAAIIMTSTHIIDVDTLTDDFNITDRFYYMFTSDYIDIVTTTGRLYALLYAVPAVFSSNPFLGIGPGSFMPISQQMPEEEVFAKASTLDLETKALYFVHDVGYAALFIQVGLVGLVVLIWLFVRLYRKASNSLKFEKDPIVRTLMLGSTGFFVAIAVQNFACFNLMYRNQSVIIWSLCGLIALFSIINKNHIKGGGEVENSCR